MLARIKLRLSQWQTRQCTHLFARHGVAHQSQKHELLEASQRIQICQLGETVLGQYQGVQIRYTRREVGLYAGDAVLGEKQRAQAGLQREVAELRDIVVGQVDGVVVLAVCQSLATPRVAPVSGLTRAAPMFSMAAILWPRVHTH